MLTWVTTLIPISHGTGYAFTYIKRRGADTCTHIHTHTYTYTQTKGHRYWSAQEHQRFLEGLHLHGRQNFKSIAEVVTTRTHVQVLSKETMWHVKRALQRCKRGLCHVILQGQCRNGYNARSSLSSNMSEVSCHLKSGLCRVQKSATHYSTHYSTLQHTATHCNTLQHIATTISKEAYVVCKRVQHTTAHCNTLQPFWNSPHE